MLTGIKIIKDDEPLTVDMERLKKLRKRINRMLEREVRAQCRGKFSESYVYQNMDIDASIEDVMTQIRYQIQWQQHAIEVGLL